MGTCLSRYTGEGARRQLGRWNVPLPGSERISLQLSIFGLCWWEKVSFPVSLLLSGKQTKHWLSPPLPLHWTDTVQSQFLIVNTGWFSISSKHYLPYVIFPSLEEHLVESLENIEKQKEESRGEL